MNLNSLCQNYYLGDFSWRIPEGGIQNQIHFLKSFWHKILVRTIFPLKIVTLYFVSKHPSLRRPSWPPHVDWRHCGEIFFYKVFGPGEGWGERKEYREWPDRPRPWWKLYILYFPWREQFYIWFQVSNYQTSDILLHTKRNFINIESNMSVTGNMISEVVKCKKKN